MLSHALHGIVNPAEAAVSSTALSNAANSVGGYTAGTLRAAFLAKIWQTMGTPAINTEAS